MKPASLRFRPLATAQITEAFNRYLDLDAALAERWLNALDESFSSIEHFPLSHSVLFDAVRRIKVKNFPYLLLYFVTEAGDRREAVIVACVHERSDPQTWR